MGFLSGLFGGGSSGSTSTVSNDIEVNPVTNVYFDVDELANAIREGNEDSVKLETVKLLLLKEQIQTQQEEVIQSEKALKTATSFIPILLLISGVYIYKKGFK